MPRGNVPLAHHLSPPDLRSFHGSRLFPDSRSPHGAAGCSRKGFARRNNQDSWCIDDVGEGAQLLTIADGLGGLSHGDMASRMAIAVMNSVCAAGLTICDWQDDRQIESVLAQAVQRAGEVVARQASKRECRMGTTLCAALVLDETRAWIINVGDSRCYLLRDGEVAQLSRDQTDGERVHALGSPHSPAVIDRLEMCPGDRLLLCTDGIWRPLSRRHLQTILRSCETAAITSDALMWEALCAGGADDLTCIVHDHCVHRR